MVVTSSQMDKNSFKSVLIKKINGVYDKLSVLFFHLKRKFKLFWRKGNLKILKKSSRVQLNENLNINELINYSGQVLGDGKAQ